MAAKRPHLHKLANKLGIIPSYIDYSGVRRLASDATRVALIEAMGWKAGTEQKANESLQALSEDSRREFGNDVTIVPVSSRRAQVTMRVPMLRKGSFAFTGFLFCEGKRLDFKGESLKRGDGSFVDVPLHIPIGPTCHNFEITIMQNGRVNLVRPYVQFVPSRCWAHVERGVIARLSGVSLNLYTLRSQSNWGVGDCGDLNKICDWLIKQDGDWIGINPLHIVRNRAPQVSPYSPMSRWYQNPLYLHVESIPEYDNCRNARKLITSPRFKQALLDLRASDSIDYTAAYDAKLEILRLLHNEFISRHGALQTKRSRDYAEFVRAGGYHLQEFATFCALDDHFRETRKLIDWRSWPREYRDFYSSSVSKFRQERAREVAFHLYLQFELDRQLGKVQEQLHSNKDRLGLYQDIAVGSAPSGYDTWSNGRLFASNVDVGCPPDAHASQGQNWSFRPIDPWQLREQGYWYWQDLLRKNMKHAGMVRIDHAMGLMRQFWIPKGRPPSEGAYVRYPMDDLLGILAIESHHHKCMVVGEDLGTVPKGFSDTLKKWGILSTRLMMFERNKRGQFRKPSEYREFAVTSATNHDLPPLKGFLEGTDLELRKKIGLFKSKAAWEKANKDRAADVRALIRRLVAERLLDKRYLIREPRTSAREVSRKNASSASSGVPYQVILEAVHRFLGRTPSKVVAVMLDDLLGETEPINLPGVGPDKHASWSRKMTRTLEDALADPAVARAFQAVRAGKRRVASRKGAKPQKKKR